MQYKKIVLYKQDFITEIKSPSYKESKEYLIVFTSLPSKISGSVCIKIFDHKMSALHQRPCQQDPKYM